MSSLVITAASGAGFKDIAAGIVARSSSQCGVPIVVANGTGTLLVLGCLRF